MEDLEDRPECDRGPDGHDGQLDAPLARRQCSPDSSQRTPARNREIHARAPLPRLDPVRQADPSLTRIYELDPLAGRVDRERPRTRWPTPRGRPFAARAAGEHDGTRKDRKEPDGPHHRTVAVPR